MKSIAPYHAGLTTLEEILKYFLTRKKYSAAEINF